MSVFILFTLSITVLYIFIILSFVFGWLRLKDYKTQQNQRIDDDSNLFLTLLIAAKNEEATLRLLLFDLENQTLDIEYFEIIIIDDLSDDTTPEILESFRERHPNVSILKTDISAHGKKAALRLGIQHARGNYIVTTDADCRFGENRLQIVYNFCSEKSPQIVVGPVAMCGNGFFSDMQSLEFQSLAASTAGAVGIGHSIMCNAANLVYKKEIFRQFPNAMNDEYLSGDDVFLLHKVKREIKNGIFYLKNKDALVHTKTEATLFSFFRQRLRWTSKSSGYSDFDTLLTAFLVLGINLLIVILLTMSILKAEYFQLFILVFVLKLGIDFLLLVLSADFFGMRRKLVIFPILALIYPFYIVFTALFGFFYQKKKK